MFLISLKVSTNISLVQQIVLKWAILYISTYVLYKIRRLEAIIELEDVGSMPTMRFREINSQWRATNRVKKTFE